MIYLLVGLCALAAVALRGGRVGAMAALLALAAFGYAFFVYRWWMPPAAAAAAVAVGYPFSRALRRDGPRAFAAFVGAALAGFAVLGPADGLF